MGFTFEIAGAQIDGARDYQEDSFLITRLEGNNDANGLASLIILADGMGGHAAGNVASNMAVQACNKYITTNYPNTNMPEMLRESVLAANNAIKETIVETDALQGMGCTLIAALLKGNSLYWVSVGDSHLYLVRDGELEKKNADHSYSGFLDRMAKEGKEVQPDPRYAGTMLLSALAGDEIAEIDCPEDPLEIHADDRVLVCSDGLDTLSSDEITSSACSKNTAKGSADTLLAEVEAVQAPRQDNTTVVAVHILPERAPAQGLASEADTIPGEAKPLDSSFSQRATQRPDKKGLRYTLVGLGVVAVIASLAGVWWKYSPTLKDFTISDILSEIDKKGSEELVEEVEQAVPEAPVVLPETPVVLPETPEESEPDGVNKVSGTVSVGLEPFIDPLKMGGVAPKMVWIPAGSFEMGSPSSSVNFDERPRHTVTLERFAISQYEITYANYEKFSRATGYRMPKRRYDKSHPVVNVSWEDANKYARWLSQQTGYKYRLPSEAEWEYAASAGKLSTYWWGYRIGTGNAHCFDCGEALNPGKPVSVGSFAQNPFGIYDTAGNIKEWVQDCYHESYEGAPTDGGVWKGGDCSLRVIRGGSFRTPGKSIRPRKRHTISPNKRPGDIGIRLTREP